MAGAFDANGAYGELRLAVTGAGLAVGLPVAVAQG